MRYLILFSAIFLLSATSAKSPTDEELVTSLSVPGTGLTAKHKEDHKLRIESVVKQGNNKPIITIEGEQFEVSPFSDMSDSWIRGQRVELQDSKQYSYYNVIIKNIDNGEQVKARKLTGSSNSQF